MISVEFLRPLIRQSTYAPLEIELDDVRKASENVERTIQLCNQRRLAQVADEVRGGQATMYEFKTALKVLFSQQYVNAKCLFLFRPGFLRDIADFLL